MPAFVPIRTAERSGEAAFARGDFEPPSCTLAPRGASASRYRRLRAHEGSEFPPRPLHFGFRELNLI